VWLVVSLLLLIGVFVASLSYLAPEGTDGEEVSYGRLTGVLAPGRQVIEGTFFDFDKRVIGTYRGAEGQEIDFFTSYAGSDTTTPALISALTNGGADVTIDPQTQKESVQFATTYLLPLVILANLFAIIFLGAQGGSGAFEGLTEFSSIGKGRGGEADRAVTFADVAGAKDAVVELAEVKDYLLDPQRFAAIGAKPPKGVLMAGPPGTGKTLMARAVAGEAGVPFFSVSGSEFVESLVGVGAARVRDLFKKVREVAPAIVFIDEIDAAGRKRGSAAGGSEEREQTLNQLLIEMDGFDPTAGLVVIGATNRPDILDPALLRPGRFDRQVVIDVPDLDGRAEILSLYLGKRPTEADVDIRLIARRTPGFAGADLSNIVNEASLLAVRGGRETITMADLEEAVQRVSSGSRRRGHLMTDEERRRAAHHEAGHVVVGALTGRLGDTPRVSIVAHGRTLGTTGAASWAERTLLTRAELATELATLLAGGVVEEDAFGDPSTGSDDDLDRATTLAQQMVGRYGMTERLGRVRVLSNDGSDYLGASLVPGALASDEVLTALHDEVRRLLDEAAATVRQIAAAHADVVDAVVEALLDHESMEGAELERLIAHLRPTAVDVASTEQPRRPRSG